ncbi:hypothetical protein Glove_173g76 [Diversispora epigaea]|uniref:Crinkler effector protein N-terminal domain-containing protein n=1 Tax=Diversispora epigaea TaxID=1348612 RepID=A0A397ITU0_9GLOM|nr:hypothetical protein Glove_173g76 [Diversispora epigaea]
MDTITLGCLVKGDDPYDNYFEVEINKTRAVSVLRELIKDKKKPNFDHLPADRLKLWKINVSLSKLNEKLNILISRNLSMIEEGLEGIKLLASNDIQDYFNEPIKKHIHIIVEPPEPTLETLRTSKEQSYTATLTNLLFLYLVPLYFQYRDPKVINLSSDNWESFVQLYTLLQNVFDLKGPLTTHEFFIENNQVDFGWSKIDFVEFIEKHKCSANNPIRISDVNKGTIFQLSANRKKFELMQSCSAGTKRSYFESLDELPSPSKLGEPDEWFKRQKNAIFCFNHRPEGTSSTIPVSLYCSIFGEFKDFCKEAPEREDNLFTYEFCVEMRKFYKSEEARQVKANEMLSKYFDRSVQPMQLAGNHKTDGTMSYSGPYAYRELNIEYKKELCSSNVCPHLKSCAYYLDFCKEQKNSSLLHATNFPCFLVVIAGPYFSVSGAVLSNKAIIDPLTPIFPLLWQKNEDEMMVLLSGTFRALKKSLKLLDQYYDRINKSARKIPQTDRFVHPSFPEVIVNGKSYSVRIDYQVGVFLLWKVILSDDLGSRYTAYVKAVRKHQYSLDTHQLLAEAEYAPKVLTTSLIPGNWRLVYMECLDEHSMLNCITSNLNNQERNSLREKIENVIKYLHNLEYVHGDLREGNLLIRKLEDNDFDVKLIDFEWSGKVGIARYSNFMNHIGIQWPNGAEDGKLVTKDHDLVMLNHTFQICRINDDFSAYSEESENEYSSDEYLEKWQKCNSTATYYHKCGSRGKFTEAAKETKSLTNFFKSNNSNDNKNKINNETVSFIRINSGYNENEINEYSETSGNNKMSRHNEIDSEIGVHNEIIGRHNEIIDGYSETDRLKLNNETGKNEEMDSETDKCDKIDEMDNETNICDEIVGRHDEIMDEYNKIMDRYAEMDKGTDKNDEINSETDKCDEIDEIDNETNYPIRVGTVEHGTLGQHCGHPKIWHHRYRGYHSIMSIADIVSIMDIKNIVDKNDEINSETDKCDEIDEIDNETNYPIRVGTVEHGTLGQHCGHPKIWHHRYRGYHSIMSIADIASLTSWYREHREYYGHYGHHEFFTLNKNNSKIEPFESFELFEPYEFTDITDNLNIDENINIEGSSNESSSNECLSNEGPSNGDLSNEGSSNENIISDINSNGKKCGQKYSTAKTSSTSTLSYHLKQVHQISIENNNDESSKQSNQQQVDKMFNQIKEHPSIQMKNLYKAAIK